ncbi:hypothetical protein PSACC_02981 [Paramicrosporidium saccamoebae]|uniref:C3H1-type domain-containing protein n=1 Tax=Paramicrosporidium saccamoebae TaxID=1246581 RepID=A0A2H9THI6_9FUNG|nr:hypothetical protein PSACC_02981 [Paramicrosporidium saccamoebae]
MPICRFFVQGRCQFGSECKFEHPGDTRAAFHETRHDSPRQSQPRPRPPVAPSSVPRQDTIRFLSLLLRYNTIRPEDVIKHDLLNIKMEWPLSCYGLNVSWEGGDNIIHTDFSPEELRCEAYAQNRTVGNIDAYKQTLAHVIQEKQRTVAEIMADPSKGVALGRTPRAVRLQHLNNLKNQAQVSHSAPAAGISQLPPPAATAHGDPKSGSYTFGDIPELPPS